MDRKNKRFIFLIWVGFFALLTGCTTKPKPPEKLSNSYQGYVYYKALKGHDGFKQENIPGWLKVSMERVASEEFEQRKAQFSGVIQDKSLQRKRDYIKDLEEPISIQEDRWTKGSDVSLSKKEREIVENYWDANRPIRFKGDEVSDDWALELINVRRQLVADEETAAEWEQKIDALRKQQQFRDAIAMVENLRPYEAERADELVSSLNLAAAVYWAGQRKLQLGELRDAEAYDLAHEKKVVALYDEILNDIEEFGHEVKFNGALSDWQDLLGENWRKQIVIMGEGKKYWEAYEFSKARYERYVDTSKFDESYREGLRLKIGKGYLTILDNAIRHYSDQATSAYTKSLTGEAYVYCCMAKEMYDFTTVATLGYHEESETWFNMISELEEKELVPALNARVARRLVVLDFDMDILGLSKVFRQACVEKYVPGNDVAWGLEIVTKAGELGKIKDGDDAVDPDEYVVEWSRSDFKVQVQVGNPVQRIEYVKTANVRLVDNPGRRDKSSEFYKLKQVKAQEVDQWSIIEMSRGIDLSCNMDVSCWHRESKNTLQLTGTEKSIKNINDNFSNVTNSTCLLMGPGAKTLYYTPDTPNNTILPDEPPQNKITEIPDEDKIKELLTGSIIIDLDRELGQLVGMYPIDLLGDTARDGSSEYLDALGTVLFYVVKLSSTEASMTESAGMGYEWLHLRDQVAANMTKWCGPGERWDALPIDKKTMLNSFWEECIKVGKDLDDR